MREFVQIKADVPRDLKRRTFAAFAMRDEKFAPWLRARLEEFLKAVEEQKEDKSNARLARS